jgi:hypothetical protein
MVRAREAVLRDHPFTLRPLIDRLTLDNRASHAARSVGGKRLSDKNPN